MDDYLDATIALTSRDGTGDGRANLLSRWSISMARAFSDYFTRSSDSITADAYSNKETYLNTFNDGLENWLSITLPNGELAAFGDTISASMNLPLRRRITLLGDTGT